MINISNNNHTYNNPTQDLAPTTATNNFIHPNITEVQLSYRQLFTRSVRQLAYSYQTGNKNELMSAEEFKSKLGNNEKFCPNTVYVVYADISEEEKSYTIPRIVFNAVYNYVLDTNYMGTLDLSSLSDAEANNLPNRLHVKGSVNLSKTNICKLPKEFIVDHDLNISECPNLTKLPEKLSVKNLINAHKSGIKYLNTKFNAGSLDVSECIDLEEIPEKPLNVCSDINFSNCPKIKHMPSWIISITSMPSNYILRGVHLNGTAISYDTVINKIEEFKKANMNNAPNVKIFCNNQSNDGKLQIFSMMGMDIEIDESENKTEPGSEEFIFSWGPIKSRNA